jgi:membrane-associated protein
MLVPSAGLRRPSQPMSQLLDLFLHLDKKLGPLLQQHGTTAYFILAGVLFCQTGVILTPFLPGDSLLFAIGIFCHPDKSSLNIWLMFVLLMAAGFLGTSLNYFIGMYFGEGLFRSDDAKVFKKSHLAKTHEMFEKHGRIAMVLTPFVPIVRTFAPFAAGLGKMPYGRFIGYAMLGLTIWIGLFLFGGFFIGGIKVVQDNFGLAVILILVVTGAPLCWEGFKAYRESRSSDTPAV